MTIDRRGLKVKAMGLTNAVSPTSIECNFCLKTTVAETLHELNATEVIGLDVSAY